MLRHGAERHSPFEARSFCASVGGGWEHVFVSDVRRCGRCGESKPAGEFNWRREARGQRDSLCRPCRAAYHREHYLRNKQRYVDQARARKRALALERTAYLFEYFADHPCADCGEEDVRVLEFDHLQEKAFNIGQALAYRAWSSILAEIEKCEVVCANCHRRRTARRGGHLRHVLRESGRPDSNRH